MVTGSDDVLTVRKRAHQPWLYLRLKTVAMLSVVVWWQLSINLLETLGSRSLQTEQSDHCED